MLTPEQIIAEMAPHLTLDLAPKNWQRLAKRFNVTEPAFGCCYPAAEVLYHLWGKYNGFKPATKRSSPRRGDLHWFLRHPDGRILDPTASQFGNDPFDYTGARGCGFLTKQPSKRAQILLNRMVAAGLQWPFALCPTCQIMFDLRNHTACPDCTKPAPQDPPVLTSKHSKQVSTWGCSEALTVLPSK